MNRPKEAEQISASCGVLLAVLAIRPALTRYYAGSVVNHQLHETNLCAQTTAGENLSALLVNKRQNNTVCFF